MSFTVVGFDEALRQRDISVAACVAYCVDIVFDADDRYFTIADHDLASRARLKLVEGEEFMGRTHAATAST